MSIQDRLAPPTIRGRLTLTADHPAGSTVLIVKTAPGHGYLAANAGSSLQINGDGAVYSLGDAAVQTRPDASITLSISPPLYRAQPAGAAVGVAEQARRAA